MKSDERKKRAHFIADVVVIVVSVVFAVILAKTGFINRILVSTLELEFVGSFVAGIFFTSIFTVAPATVILGTIARETSVWLVALCGGLGALLGDFIIFHFVERRLAEDFAYLLQKTDIERFASIFHRRLFRWLFQFVGALVVASPLPDELGLAMMGLSKIRLSLFVPISFFLNSVGILAIGLIARVL